MRRSLLLLAISSSVLLSHAQDGSSILVNDFTIHFGNSTTNSNQIGESRFLQLIPSADAFLLNEGDGFSEFSQTNSNFAFNALLGLRFDQKGSESPRQNPTLRLGINYESSTPITYYKQSRTTYRIDTLTSSQTGQESYIDSVDIQTTNGSYDSERIRLEASLIYRSNTDKRVSFYAGGGLSVGVSFNNRTDFTHVESYSIDGDPSVSYFGFGELEYITEKNEGSWILSGFIPMGAEFRLAKAHPTWSKMHLNLEVRPGISTYDIPELGRETDSYFQGLFGIRYNVQPTL